MRISDVVATLRQRGASGSVNDELLARLPSVRAFFERVREAENDILENTTIANLMQAAEPSSVNEAR